MSFRGPKGVKLYHNGELCAEMESVNATVDLLMLHDSKHRGCKRVKHLYYDAVKNNTELFGFTFVPDPDWESSRKVMATDVETNETFVKDSVGEMAKVIFGPVDNAGTNKISCLCRSNKVHKGLIFNYVNEDDGYLIGYKNHDCKKPVQQLDIATGFVINDFPSISQAAQYVWDIGLSSASSVLNIKAAISACANFTIDFPNGEYLGYRWRIKTEDNN